MSNRIKLRACEFDQDSTSVVYGRVIEMRGRNPGEWKALERIARAFEAIPDFLAHVPDGPCPQCHSLRAHFQVKDGVKSIVVPLRQEDRDLILERVVVNAIEKGAPLGVRRAVIDVAKCLGSRYLAKIRERLAAELPDDSEETEIVQDDE